MGECAGIHPFKEILLIGICHNEALTEKMRLEPEATIPDE